MDGKHGGKYTAHQLAKQIHDLWTDPDNEAFVVFTGGEPMLQLDRDLIEACKVLKMELAIETNGTIEVPSDMDWICVSPKANTEVVQKSGSELKIVYPQSGIDPLDFENWKFEHFYIQPMDSEELDENTIKATNFCRNHPQWKLSIQTHKILGIP